MKAQECYEMGKAYHAQGQYEKSHKYYQKAIQLASEELPKVDAREAIKYLAEKAHEFFELEYYASSEIHNIIKKYSELLATVQMEFFNYRDTTDDVINNVIKPFDIYEYKLITWIFDTIRIARLKNFPNKFYYNYKIFRLFDDNPSPSDLEKISDDVLNAVTKEFAIKLMLGFVTELYRSIKEHYERILQTNYPIEYHIFLTDKDGLSGLWNELHGRSIKIVFDCIKSLGLNNIDIVNMEKIIYGNLNIDVRGNDADINIIKNFVLGTEGIKVSVTTKEEAD